MDRWMKQVRCRGACDLGNTNHPGAAPMPFVAAGLPCAWRQPMRNAAQPASLGKRRLGHLSGDREKLREILSMLAGTRRVVDLVRRMCLAPAAAFIAA